MSSQVTIFEGDGGQRGFAIVSDNHPLPTAGLELLISRSQRPRVVKSGDPWRERRLGGREGQRPGAGTGLSVASESSSGTTFTRVFKGLQAQGSA